MVIPEVVTVSDARAGLSQILADLSESGADADPVLIGAHRKPQGVLLSVEAYEALSGRAARRAAVASATGSIEAEGLHASEASDRDTEAYVKGDVDADTLVARAIARHRQASERRAG
ncbi:type II toxin-antitoxin system Phd/YefM family antitoxin [Streptomyces cellostaticus]|uniref:antitoxin VbhA family protein n=1 Tax=Streptomyces TaxID=1883 RepID=UPI002027693A|nr:type II toxin-antitoxin system Phd/YefM family antitoxin [Streptomyces cellostaticus]